MPFNLVALTLIIIAAHNDMSKEKVLFAIGFSLSVASFIYDSAVQVDWITFSSFYLSHVAVPLILAAMGFVLTVRFAETLEREENINHELEQRVKSKKRALIKSYEVMMRLENDRVRSDERNRIMRDIHDRLGSQLLSSLAMVEAGEMKQKEVAQVLR